MISEHQKKLIGRIRAGETVWMGFDGHRIQVDPDLTKSNTALAFVPYMSRAILAIVDRNSEKNGFYMYALDFWNGKPYYQFDVQARSKRLKFIGSVISIHDKGES